MQLKAARDDYSHDAPPPGGEPAINIPGVILAMGAVMMLIHAIRLYILTPDQDLWAILVFSFIPLRYGAEAGLFPVETAQYWTPLTYSLLHADWLHAGINLVWLVAFGTPLARRIGAVRTLLLGALASLGGAAVHYLFYSTELAPVIGASAVVSGYMGAAARFAFRPGRNGMLQVHGPALSLFASFTDRRFLSFVGIWMAINFLFSSGLLPIAGEEADIAWQAHVGGFLAGLLGFSLLDRER